jgi:hypothetical protein
LLAVDVPLVTRNVCFAPNARAAASCVSFSGPVGFTQMQQLDVATGREALLDLQSRRACLAVDEYLRHCASSLAF